MNDNIGLLINSSRGIIYASRELTMPKGKEEALKMLQEMSAVLVG
jgi:orotidine-5'-phosphate decarboxylase